MVKIKRMLRHFVFVLAICLACLVPIPVIFRSKEHSNQIWTEQVDEDEDDENNKLKELF